MNDRLQLFYLKLKWIWLKKIMGYDDIQPTFRDYLKYGDWH